MLGSWLGITRSHRIRGWQGVTPSHKPEFTETNNWRLTYGPSYEGFGRGPFADAQGSNTFEAIATELLEKKRREGRAENTLAKDRMAIQPRQSDPRARPIKETGVQDILTVLRTVESRGKREFAKTASRDHGQVFRHAVATGRADGDPTGALAGRPR